MADYRIGFKSAYIAAVEFGGKQPTLTIESVKLESLEDEKGKKRDRWIVRFRNQERGLVLNRTNAEIIAALWGRDTDGWAGHAITLRAEKVQMGRETVDGIRIAGSPELTAPRTVTVKLPRKRPVEVKLVPTGKGKPPAPVQDREPGEDEEAA